MQRRGWWFPSPQEESAVWPSGRRSRGQGSRGERFCEPSLSSASSRWSLLRIRRNKKTPMLVFWVQHSESIFCSRRMANIVLKDLHTQSTVHCTVQPGLTKGKRDLMGTPITRTGRNAPGQKQAQMHLTGPSITVFKVRPFGRSGSAGSQTGGGAKRHQAGKKVGELVSRRLVSHSTHGSQLQSQVNACSPRVLEMY